MTSKHFIVSISTIIYLLLLESAITIRSVVGYGRFSVSAKIITFPGLLRFYLNALICSSLKTGCLPLAFSLLTLSNSNSIGSSVADNLS